MPYWGVHWHTGEKVSENIYKYIETTLYTEASCSKSQSTCGSISMKRAVRYIRILCGCIKMDALDTRHHGGTCKNNQHGGCLQRLNITSASSIDIAQNLLHHAGKWSLPPVNLREGIGYSHQEYHTSRMHCIICRELATSPLPQTFQDSINQ